MPKVNEMNLISDEMGRDVKFILQYIDEEKEKLQIVV